LSSNPFKSVDNDRRSRIPGEGRVANLSLATDEHWTMGVTTTSIPKSPTGPVLTNSPLGTAPQEHHRGSTAAAKTRRAVLPPGKKAVPMTEPLFSTKVVDSDDGPIIYVQGEIDMTTAGRLRNAIEPHMGPRQTIILDFSGVEFLDSSCISVLAHARGSLSADGGSLILRNPSRSRGES